MPNKTINVIVGSKNPVKVGAVNQALSAIFPDHNVECLGVNAPSQVADQPMTSEETRLGAINRVKYCQQHHQADYYVAIEGGVDNLTDGPVTFAYIVITKGSQSSMGRSAMLPLPPVVYQALQQGEELGHVMDRLFNTENVKQKGGAIGLLTNGLESRMSNYTQAITLAMAPFLQPQLFKLISPKS